MLVVSRKKNESIVIGDNITVCIVEILGDKVRMGIDAPKNVKILRNEIFDRIQHNQQKLGTCSHGHLPGRCPVAVCQHWSRERVDL